MLLKQLIWNYCHYLSWIFVWESQVTTFKRAGSDTSMLAFQKFKLNAFKMSDLMPIVTQSLTSLFEIDVVNQ